MSLSVSLSSVCLSIWLSMSVFQFLSLTISLCLSAGLSFCSLSVFLLVRIEAKHPELRDPRAKGDPRPRGPPAEGSRVPGGPRYQEVEDDEADPNYARINSFRDRGNVASTSPSSPPYSAHPPDHGRVPSPPQHPAHPGYSNHGNDPAMGANGDPMDGLYAKVNKPRGGASMAAPGGTSPPPTHGGAGDR